MDSTTTALICNIFDFVIYFLLMQNLISYPQKKKASHHVSH